MTTDPRPAGAAALRAKLDHRLRAESVRRGIDVNRLRRQVAFERLLVRLGDRWVLKGGLALEFRLDNQCRATRDIDLALTDAAEDGDQVREHLIDTLAEDPQGDHFTFAVAAAKPLAADLAGRPGWRYPVDVRLAGKSFVSIRLDVVARAEEIAGAVEELTIRSALEFAGYPASISVAAIDVHQHAAEKLHALTRDYGDRPNTRTKDLVDLVLLIENELIEPAGLDARLRVVFAERGSHDLPADLTPPPASWTVDYQALTADLDITARTVDTGYALVREFCGRWLRPPRAAD